MITYFCIISVFVLNAVYATNLDILYETRNVSITQSIIPILLLLLFISQKSRQNNLFSFLLTFSLIWNIVNSENVTNDTTTSPTYTTTQFFTTTSSYNLLDGTYSPTIGPTKAPYTRPTPTPTMKPIYPCRPRGESCLNTVAVTCRGIDVDIEWFRFYGYHFFLSIFWDALGLSAASQEFIQVEIGEVTDVIDDTSERRRVLAEDVVVGVTIQYLVAIDDGTTLNAFKESINSGSFSNEFEQGIDDNFVGVDVDDDIVIEDGGIGDSDKFLGKEEATFGEIIASPFILLGIVCTIVGIVWLLFLRSTIENKYPSYLSQPQSSSSMAVEMAMVPQTSTASAGDDIEKKQNNKQELQQAWNESDAEVE